jgi:hypothetical protein
VILLPPYEAPTLTACLLVDRWLDAFRLACDLAELFPLAACY